MIRSIHVNKTADSNLLDLVAVSKVSISKYISGLIEKEYELIKPPAHDTFDNNGIQQQPQPQEEGKQNDHAEVSY